MRKPGFSPVTGPGPALRLIGVAAVLYTVGTPVLADDAAAPAETLALALEATHVDELESLIETRVATAASGAASRLNGLHATPLTPSEATAQARQRSLFIEARGGRYNQSAYGITQAESAFDPTVLWTVRENRVKFNGRTALIHRLREKTVDFEKLEADFATLADGGVPVDSNVCVLVDGNLINGDTCTSTTEVSTQVEFASFNSIPRDTIRSTLNLSKAMRWGGVFDIGLNVQDREKFGFSFGTLDGPFAARDPLNNGTQYQWTAGGSLSFSTPLPYSRNFGTYGNPASVNVMLAEQAQSRARADYGAASNSVLAEAQRRYWTLVQRALELNVAQHQRETMAESLGHVERSFDAGQVTQYDLRQAQAQLENFRDQEEIAWNAYVKASNAIIELLNLSRDQYIIPTGFKDAILAIYDIDPDAATRDSLGQRPEISASMAALEAADIVLENRRIQTRPDLSLVVNYSTSQTDAILGYRNAWDSVGNIFDPDQDDFFIGLFYRIPFGNRPARAQLGQAQAARQQARDALEQVRVQVAEEVKSAVSALYARRREVDLTRINLALANEAYEAGQHLREVGNTSEFNLLQTFNDLLVAQYAHIRALTAYQAAWVDVSAAQGRFAEYPE